MQRFQSKRTKFCGRLWSISFTQRQFLIVIVLLWNATTQHTIIRVTFLEKGKTQSNMRQHYFKLSVGWRTWRSFIEICLECSACTSWHIILGNFVLPTIWILFKTTRIVRNTHYLSWNWKMTNMKNWKTECKLIRKTKYLENFGKKSLILILHLECRSM